MDIPLKCTCGKMRAVAIAVVAEKTNRATCMCDDCQAYAHFLGRASEILDVYGGTDIFPVTPAQLKITQGIENLKCMRLSAQGMYRWYAGCCKTPIGNSMASHKVPFVGMIHLFVDLPQDARIRDEAFGPIRARMFGKYGTGPLPPDASEKAPAKFIFRTMRSLLLGFLKQQYKPSPFFNTQTGEPVVTPYVLTQAERNNL